MFYDTLMEKRAGLDKSAFKYNRDMLGALGGGVIGGGLGYASSTDGKNNTRDNRLKRTLIGAGLGGGVGLGFGRMSRKLKDARGTIGDKNQALVNMQGGHKQELSDLESRLQQGHQKSTESLLGHHDDEIGHLREKHKQLGEEFTDYRSSAARANDNVRTAHEEQLSNLRFDKETTDKASREHSALLGRVLKERETELHDLKARDQFRRDTGNAIPEHVLDRMAPDQVREAAKKRLERAHAQATSKSRATNRADARLGALDSLKNSSEKARYAENFLAGPEAMPSDALSAYAAKHGLGGEGARELRHLASEQPYGSEGQQYFDTVINTKMKNRHSVGGAGRTPRSFDGRVKNAPRVINPGYFGEKTSAFYSALLEKRAGRYAGLSNKFIEGPTGRYILGGALAGGAIGRKSADEDHKTRDMLLGAGIGGLAGAGMSRMHKAYNAHSMKEHGARGNVEFGETVLTPSGALLPDAGERTLRGGTNFHFQRAEKLPGGTPQTFQGKTPDALKNTPWDDLDPMQRRAFLKKKDILSAHIQDGGEHDFGLMRERELARGGRNLLLAGGAGLGLRKLRKKREEDS
jgi:hypothetical protein